MKKALLVLLLALIPLAGPPTGQQLDRSGWTLQTAAAAQEPDNKDVTVYVTRKGTKYHREGCRYLRGGGMPLSLVEAAKRYTACSVCNPPLLAQATAPEPAAARRHDPRPAEHRSPGCSGAGNHSGQQPGHRRQHRGVLLASRRLHRRDS